MILLREVVAILIIAILIGYFSWIPVSYADSVNPGVYSADSSPFGLSHSEWTAEWWRWFISIPENQTPADDPTGARCAINQQDPNVWFLTGAFEGKVERDCVIPFGRAILLPIIANECSYAEYPDLSTEAELRQCAVAGDTPSELGATLDGVEVMDIRRYSVESPLFDINFPENNVFGAEPGSAQAVSHFYSLFLEPLNEGTHELRFFQITLENPATGASGFSYDVTYHLIIEKMSYILFTESVTVANKSSTIAINSSSTLSNFSFSEHDKRLSFTALESGSQGLAVIPVGTVLIGPYTVLLDDNPISNFRATNDNTTGTTSIKIAYPPGTHDIVIIGTSVVPEFSTISLIMLAISISTVVGLMNIKGRRKSFSW